MGVACRTIQVPTFSLTPLPFVSSVLITYVCVQRFHRSRNFRRALIRERTNQRRAVRIRIHELTLYLTDAEVSLSLSVSLCLSLSLSLCLSLSLLIFL
jgi:hypothetical protein